MQDDAVKMVAIAWNVGSVTSYGFAVDVRSGAVSSAMSERDATIKIFFYCNPVLLATFHYAMAAT